MKTIEFPEFKDYIDQNVHFLQPKRDGHLCKIFIDSSGNIQAFSKNDKDITTKVLSINHIHRELIGLPCSSTLFGEMWSPGVFAYSVPKLLNYAD